MILTIDVGNTNVVLGCVENGEVKKFFMLLPGRRNRRSRKNNA